MVIILIKASHVGYKYMNNNIVIIVYKSTIKVVWYWFFFIYSRSPKYEAGCQAGLLK